MANQSYQGKPVRSVRDAREGDKGFVKGSVDQVIITLEDGTEKTIKKSELTVAGSGSGGSSGSGGGATGGAQPKE